MEVGFSCPPSISAANGALPPQSSHSLHHSPRPSHLAAASVNGSSDALPIPLPSESGASPSSTNGSAVAFAAPPVSKAAAAGRAPTPCQAERARMPGRDGTSMHPAVAALRSQSAAAPGPQAPVSSSAAETEGSQPQRFAPGLHHHLEIRLK